MNLKTVLIIFIILSQNNIFCLETKSSLTKTILPLYVCQALEGSNTKLEKTHYHVLKDFINECNLNISRFKKLRGLGNRRLLLKEELKLQKLINLMKINCPQILNDINEEFKQESKKSSKIIGAIAEVEEVFS